MDALGWKTPRAQRNTKGAFTPNWLGSIKMDPRVFPRFLWFALVGMKPVSRFNQPDIKSRDKQRHFLTLQKFVLSHSSEIDELKLPTLRQTAYLQSQQHITMNKLPHFSDQTEDYLV